MSWTEPQYVTAGEASSTQFNAETVDNLIYLKAIQDSLPKGVMGTPVFITASTSQALTTSLADLSGVSIAFTAEAGRRYLILAHVMFDNCPSPRFVRMSILRGSTVISNGHVHGATAGGNCYGDLMAHDAPGAGSVTYKVQALVDNVASGTIWTAGTPGSTTGPTSFIVLDVGES